MDDKLNVDILEETIKAFKVLGKECIKHIYKAAYNEAIEDTFKLTAITEILKLKKE